MEHRPASLDQSINFAHDIDYDDPIICLTDSDDETSQHGGYNNRGSSRSMLTTPNHSRTGETGEGPHHESLSRLYPSPPRTQSQSSDEGEVQVKQEPRMPAQSPHLRVVSRPATTQQTLEQSFSAQAAAAKKRPRDEFEEWRDHYDGDEDPAEFSANKKLRKMPARGSLDRQNKEKTAWDRLMSVRTSSHPRRRWIKHHGKQKIRTTPLTGRALPPPKVQEDTDELPLSP